jgi:hypothetical protein
MQPLQIAIEGTHAAKAAQALIDTTGLSVQVQPPADDEERGVLAVIASIVGIVGGTLAAAEQIRKWYQEWTKGNSGKSIEKVVLATKDKRIVLQGASVEQIAAVLETLQ